MGGRERDQTVERNKPERRGTAWSENHISQIFTNLSVELNEGTPVMLGCAQIQEK